MYQTFISNTHNTVGRKSQSTPSSHSSPWSTFLCSKECTIRAAHFSHSSRGSEWKYWSVCPQTTKSIITLWIWEYCRWQNPRPSYFLFLSSKLRKLRKCYLSKPDLTLEKVIKIIQARESAAHHSKKTEETYTSTFWWQNRNWCL